MAFNKNKERKVKTEKLIRHFSTIMNSFLPDIFRERPTECEISCIIQHVIFAVHEIDMPIRKQANNVSKTVVWKNIPS